MSDLNDPRVFFAAERTLMAWTRTSVALMAFGFAVERFGLFFHALVLTQGGYQRRTGSFWFGLMLVLFGTGISLASVVQYQSVLKTLKPIEIPEGYWVSLGVYTNMLLAAVGVGIAVFFLFSLE